uniref:C-C motif chemokine 28-like n=1 Tax=Salmo trutta TaxID=8032 RepID=A0A673ZSL5_SALTR
MYYRFAFPAVRENSQQQNSDHIKILHLYTTTTSTTAAAITVPSLRPLLLQLLQLMVNIAGGIPKCCVTTSMNIPTNVLKKVERAEMQRSNGVCDINALVLHVKGKKLCAHPKVKRKLKRMQRKKDGKPKRN